MGFPRLIISFWLIFLFSLSGKLNGQIIFRQPPNYEIKTDENDFFEITARRNILSLDGIWKVYSPEEKEIKKVSVDIPSIFTGSGELIFEKGINLTREQLNHQKFRLVFLGLNYSADISINNVKIYRHTGGEFPFFVDLPKDILTPEKSNVLSVRLNYKLEAENSLPVKQRFLFPQNFGGIIRDVYLQFLPTVSITDIDLNYSLTQLPAAAKINLKARIENKDFFATKDTIPSSNEFYFKLSAISPYGKEFFILTGNPFSVELNREKQAKENFEIASPLLWSPQSPLSYKIIIQLWRRNLLVDETIQTLSFYSLQAGKNLLTLNKENFSLLGVTYIPSFNEFGELGNYSQMRKDIELIKESGFNAVRFAKSIPHPYYLSLCEKYGLLAFIELPINSIPSRIIEKQEFFARSKNYLNQFLKGYKRFSSVAGIGLGSGFLPNSPEQIYFLSELSKAAKAATTRLVYASFTGGELPDIESIDLYGLELFNIPIAGIDSYFKREQSYLGQGRVFISEATYTVNIGNTDGYVNEHSYEAQAKYFNDLFNYNDQYYTAGFFVNTMFDYRGDFASLTSGFNESNLYRIGILGEDRDANRLAYKVLYAKLHNTENITIPIGSKKDDAPMAFILIGLFLALLTGFLVNSGKKFREDASRALMRPYNFYADVRDQRIISGFHTAFLLILISSVSALMLSNLLYSLRNSLFFEKLLLSLGNNALISTFSYLAWNPVQSLLWLSIVSGLFLIILSLFVQAASFFIKQKVFLTSSFITVIWSFLPLLLLIPVGIILYRVLKIEFANLYIYGGLALFTIWIFYRLMKGIYVIFDIAAGSVYFYTFSLIILICGGILLYYHMDNSILYYIQNAINQNNIRLK